LTQIIGVFKDAVRYLGSAKLGQGKRSYRGEIMKNYSFLIFLLFFTSPAFATETNFVSTELLNLSNNKYSIHYEWKIPGYKAKDFEASILIYKDNTDGSYEKWETDNAEIHIAYNKYSNGKESCGYFWGPRIGLRYTKATLRDDVLDINTGNVVEKTTNDNRIFYIPEIRLGYKWNMPFHIGLAMNLGLGTVTGERLHLQVNNYSHENGDFGVFLNLRVNLGYVW